MSREDDALAALTSRALNLRQSRRSGGSVESAILLDDVAADAPTAVRSERPRVSSIQRDAVPLARALAALSAHGLNRTHAAPDGNCAQRSAGCSVGWLTTAAATASDSATMHKLKAQRSRIVHRITGQGDAVPRDAGGEAISMRALRDGLGVTAGSLAPFEQIGHWHDGDAAFISFMCICTPCMCTPCTCV